MILPRGCASSRAFFLESTSGRLFGIHRAAAESQATTRGQVLLVPPFAEEMNKSRRMFGLLAQRLAAAGWGSLLIDLYGTGDSEGDFGEARWEVWCDDLWHAYQWLQQQQPPRIAVVALRMGALLALDLLSRRGVAVDRLIVWQPIQSGATMLTQFLRLRLAANMEADRRETTDWLRAQLRDGNAVEVAGYQLSPQLAAAMDALKLEPLAAALATPIDWFDIVAPGTADPAPATARAIERLRAAGVAVTAQALPGVPFWSTGEITVVPELLDRTAALLARHETVHA